MSCSECLAMALNSLQIMPFFHLDNSQMFLLLNSEVTNLSANSSSTVFSPLCNYSPPNNTDYFERFLDEQEDLKFFNVCQYYSPNDVSQPSMSHNNFVILHINARSIPKNFNKLKLLISEIQVLPIVICVTESWLTDSNFNSYTLPGYTLEACNRQDKLGGGVCNYIRNDIAYVHIDKSLIKTPFSFECIITKINLKNDSFSQSIIILTVYRPPNTCMVQFNDHLDNVLNEIAKLIKTKEILMIVGDFNIDLIKIAQHNNTHNFFNVLLAQNLVPVITKPTRLTEFSSTLIDNIFISNFKNSKFNYKSGIIYNDLSDHFPCFISFNFNCTTNITHANAPVYTRQYNNSNYSKFAQLLKSTRWEQFNKWSNFSDVNSFFNSFHKIFDSIFQEAFPMVVKSSNRGKNPGLPWLTPAIINSCKTKNKLYIKYKKYPSLLNLVTYKDYNKRLQQCIKAAEQMHYHKLLQINKSDISAKWRIINQILNKNNIDSNPVSFTINQNTTTDKKQIVEAFNSFYINLGSSLAAKISVSNLSPYDTLKPNHSNSAVFLPATEQETLQIINNLKNDSSPGWDNIPNSVIKFAKTYISLPLTNIANCMLENGSFPDQLKIAKVIPCYKSGDKTLITNYRPISILNSLSKIFENIIVIRLKSFITKHNILYNYQFGFREKYSTNLALISYIDSVTKAIDSGDKIMSVFIDLSKAFDTLDHVILIKKLNLYGFRGKVLSLFHSYLTNRKQYVQFLNHESSSLQINCGVPQGSILGPILFLLYINDIHKCSTLLNIILFADDTTLTLKHKNINELTRLMNTELNKISEWMKANKLSINVTKTFYMLFRPTSSITSIINLAINGCVINRVSQIKFLGIFIDDKLSWKVHIKHLESKISSLIGVLSKIRFKINSEVSNLIYDALLLSQLDYCNIIWCSGYKTSIHKLETLQARALRICNRLNYKLSRINTFASLNRLSLTQLNRFNIAKFVFLVLKGFTPAIFHNFFTLCKNKTFQSTRLHNNIFINSVNTNIRKMFIAYNGSILWNKLPEPIRNIVTLSSFKREVKALLLSSPSLL
jgi:hypothetical protein